MCHNAPASAPGTRRFLSAAGRRRPRTAPAPLLAGGRLGSVPPPPQPGAAGAWTCLPQVLQAAVQPVRAAAAGADRRPAQGGGRRWACGCSYCCCCWAAGTMLDEGLVCWWPGPPAGAEREVNPIVGRAPWGGSGPWCGRVLSMIGRLWGLKRGLKMRNAQRRCV